MVHEHVHTQEDASGGMGFLFGAILLIAFLMLFFFYGLPMLRGSTQNQAPQIQVPGKVDVNVNDGGQGGGQ